MGDYLRVDMDASHKVPSYFQTIPPLFHHTTDLFHPKTIFSPIFKKESSSGSAKKLLLLMGTVPREPILTTTRYPAIFR